MSLPDPKLVKRVLEMAIAVQQIPAPTFNEGRRAAFVLERFLEEGLSDVSMDAVGNVYARLPGESRASPLVVSAHLDTVFPEDTTLNLRRDSDQIYGPGIGDNATGVAGLFGLLWGLQGSNKLPGDVWLVANVGEEGLGNLCGMSAVVDRFGADVCAYLILEGMALGQIYHRGLRVRRYEISACTPGGHAWVDFGRPSAIHELAGLITRLCTIPVPEQPRSSMNVGTISGGTSVNTIAAQANCLLDLRSESGHVLARLSRQVETQIEAGNRTGVLLSWKVVGERPAGGIPSSHPLVRLAKRSLEVQGIHPLMNIGSTDANIPLSRGIPAVCVGLTTGGGAHTVKEYILTQPLELGLAQLLALVDGIFHDSR
jgi:tripeptide aminopeptidase